ncbi:hypothetical protein HDU80_007681 [Chytriomyces hyalinus]|nr:hypothetical protein HDU80_007705 [Chytriomyces hyalinus]KAJ3399682.1 hypothetical protein HDU80_007681 [Chytriomyces hyalinus]
MELIQDHFFILPQQLCNSVSKTSSSATALSVTSVPSVVVKPSAFIPTSSPAPTPAPDPNPSKISMIAGISGGVALFLALLFLWFRKNKRSKKLPDLPTDAVYLSQETNPSISETSASMSITLQPPPTLYNNTVEKNSAYRQGIEPVEFLPTSTQPSTSPQDAIGTNSTTKTLQLYDTTSYTTALELESLHTQTSPHLSSNSTAFNERYRSELLGSVFGSTASGWTKAEGKVDKPFRALTTLRENRNMDPLLLSQMHDASLPDDPKLWSQEQTAQWVFEKFGDVELLSSVMREKLTGRALLRLDRQDMVSGLGLATVGERLLFEEAIDELRRQSAEQSAFAEEQPPSYM